MSFVQSNLCNSCRNLDFDILLVASDIEERANAYERWERWPYASMGWSNTEPAERPCPIYDPDEKAGYQMYPSFTALRESAENGCELCRAVSVEVPRYMAEAEKGHRMPFGRGSAANVQWENLPVQLSFLSDMEKPGAEVWVSLLWRRRDGRKITYVLAGAFSVWIEVKMHHYRSQTYTGASEKYEALHVPVLSSGRPIPANPSSHNSILFAKTWFEKCRSEHHLCAYGRENNIPRRLVDVGPPDGSEEPRLIETQNPNISWCTLSHTWGGKVNLTTTKVTLEDRKKMIMMSELPQTFRDAVIIARRLDIRYLWIDSLCIVQDSESDWTSESCRMDAIYKNSILTISATTASNSEGGILTQRQQKFPPIGLHFRSQKYKFTGVLWIRHVLSPFDRAIESDESPLSRRGWHLQERVLTPRTLHFGAEQMFWEFRTKQEPEGLPAEEQYYGDPNRASIGWEWEMNKSYLIPLEKVQVFPGTGQIQTLYGLVENFTSRNLSKSNDKLVAISGLAAQIHKLLDNDDVYLAGLWRKDILNDLCWSPHYAGECTPAEMYRASSWSWASLDGRVAYPHHHFKRSGTPAMLMGAPYDEAEVLYVAVSSQGSYGPVTEGHIKLKTFFLSIKINAKEYFDRPAPTGRLQQADAFKTAFKSSYISQTVMKDEHRSRTVINNRYFRLVLFSEPHPFYNEEAIVPCGLIPTAQPCLSMINCAQSKREIGVYA